MCYRRRDCIKKGRTPFLQLVKLWTNVFLGLSRNNLRGLFGKWLNYSMCTLFIVIGPTFCDLYKVGLYDHTVHASFDSMCNDKPIYHYSKQKKNYLMRVGWAGNILKSPVLICGQKSWSLPRTDIPNLKVLW